jgi:hypothetical protein
MRLFRFGCTAIFTIAAVAAGSVSAQAQGTTVNAMYTGTPIVVDGQIDDAWANATAYPLAYKYGTSNFNPPTGACNAVPTIKAMWDGSMLYILISVTDPFVSGNSATVGDAAEFWVDHFNDKVAKFLEDYGTFVISAPNATGTVATSSNGTNAGGQIYPNLANRYLKAYKSALWKNGATTIGYNIEMAWAIGDHVSAIGNHASLNGTSVGFDVTVYEAPTTSTRTCRLMLSPATANRTTDTSQPWGTITLTGFDPSTSSPMQLDNFLLGVNIGAATTSALNQALPTITNKATWALTSPNAWTSASFAALNTAYTDAQTAMGSTSQITVDNATIELDAALRGLKRSGPYPYGGGPFPDPYDTTDVPYLNDPFTFLDGSRVKSLADWNRRRTEIKQMAQYYEFGWAPPPPAIVATSGTGTAKTIAMTLTANGHTWTQANAAKLTLPTGTVVNGKTAPWPVIVSIDLAGTPGAAPASYLAAGYAVLDIGYTQWAADGPTLGTTALQTLYPYDRNAGTDYGSLMGWAWGASRAVDAAQYLLVNDPTYTVVNGNGQTVPLLDMNKLSVIGFSRCGKAALVAGFLDDRFKVTAPGGSGSGGAGPYRYAADNDSPFAPKNQFGHVYWWSSPPYTTPGTSNGGEAMGDHVRHNVWNSNDMVRSFLNDRPQSDEPGPRTFQPRMYKQYTWGYATRMPFDHHLEIAAIAPRAVLLDDSVDDYADEAEGDVVGWEGAGPVFKYLGVTQNLAVDSVMEVGNPASHSLKTTQATNFIRFLDFALYGIALPDTVPAGDSSFVIPGTDLPTNVQLYTDHFLTGAADHTSTWNQYYGGLATMMPWLPLVPHANLLSALTLSSAGTITPAINSDTTSYGVDVAVFNVSVTPTAEDPNATIKVNGQPSGNGQPSQSISLNPGANPIEIDVTSVDGNTRVYSLAVNQVTISLISTATLAKLADNSYSATITVTNNGNGTAHSVSLTGGSLGSASGTVIPQALGDIPAGGFVTATVNFPASAGSSKSTVPERYLGTYVGGTFGSSIRAVLP